MKVRLPILLVLLFGFSLLQYGQNLPNDQQYTDSVLIIKQPRPIDVGDINFEIDRTRKKLLRMTYLLEPKPEFVKMDSLIVLQRAFIDKEVSEFRQFNPHNLSKYFLENTFRAWSGHKNKLLKWMSLVNKEIESTQENLDDLDFEQAVWKLTLENEMFAEDPAQLTNKIISVIKEIKGLQLQFSKQRREMIIREDNISDLVLQTDDILEEVSKLQRHLRDNLFAANKPVLWKTTFDKSELFPVLPRLKKAWHENAKTVTNFSNEVNYILVLLVAVLIVLLFFLIKRGFAKLDLSKEDPNFVIVRRIFFDHPYATITSLVFTLFILFFSTIPLILIGVLGSLLLICGLIFLPGMIGKQGKAIVMVVFVLYTVNLAEIAVWYFGNFARIFLAIESLLALFLTYKIGLQGFKRLSKNVAPFVKEVWVMSIVLFALFAIAFVANLFGFQNLAALLMKIGVKVAAIMVIIFGAHAILRAMVLAGIEIGRHTQSKLMAKQWDIIEKRSIQLINILAIIFLTKFILQNMEIYRPVMDWTADFLTREWEIGTLTISIGGIFSLILIIAVSFLLAKFVKVFIEDEFLIRTNLPKGVPAAISTTIRYFIIVLGLVMALSAAGIELGKFGLLAGALGVGIGFGLQNIVNNFISGLILVYERPVNVGDTVEVENLMGIVHRIGVRSSNVRTFDGAEVVVPNGNLISNQLINWTLSDSQRRVEVKVGAAYGSDPNVVLELLKKVAVEHGDVLQDPEPRALFDGFGDSSLDFRLLFWVHFEKGIGTKSDIAVGIYNIFAENNIQIPFPQIDLHVKKEDEEGMTVVSKSETGEKKKASKPGAIEEADLKPPE